jgi:hypothetical protein
VEAKTCKKPIGLGAVPPSDGPAGGEDDPIKVIICNDEPIEVTGEVTVTGTVTIDPDQWQALCEKLVDAFDGDLEVNATTIQPVTACLNGCDTITLCIGKGSDGFEVLGWVEAVDGALVTHEGPPDGEVTLGACKLTRQCLRFWMLNAEGTYIKCPGPEFMVELDQNLQPKKWFVGIMEIDDPTEDIAGADATMGVDYVLMPCGETVIGEPPTTQNVLIPYPVNDEADINENVLDGTVTLADLCSLVVRPDVALDCDTGTPGVTVEYTDAAGNTVVETIHCGDERCYQCITSDVTVTGLAYIYATTTEEIPIEPSEDC